MHTQQRMQDAGWSHAGRRVERRCGAVGDDARSEDSRSDDSADERDGDEALSEAAILCLIWRESRRRE